MVLTTHYLEEAEALADRVCVMARGRIASEGSVDALRARGSRSSACGARRACRWPRSRHGRKWPRRVDGERLCLSTEQVEALVRRLLAHDAQLSALEVRAAGLAEAFTEITRDDRIAELQEAA